MSLRRTPWVHQINLGANREAFYDTDYLEQSPHLYLRPLSMPSNPTGPGRGLEHQNTLHGTHPPEKVQAKVQDLQTMIQTLKRRSSRSLCGAFDGTVPTRVLYRGSPESPREMVAPAAPAILNGSLGLTQGRQRPRPALARPG